MLRRILLKKRIKPDQWSEGEFLRGVSRIMPLCSPFIQLRSVIPAGEQPLF